jgi:hypothetical protein
MWGKRLHVVSDDGGKERAAEDGLMRGTKELIPSELVVHVLCFTRKEPRGNCGVRSVHQ